MKKWHGHRMFKAGRYPPDNREKTTCYLWGKRKEEKGEDEERVGGGLDSK